MTHHPPCLRILLLEDMPSDAELILQTLHDGDLNFSSQRVATEANFIQALAEFKPDLLLSDYRLPGYSGRDALRFANENYPDIPVIMVTGALGDEAAVELLKLGAKDYVIKDHLARLVPSIQRALQEQAEQNALKKAEAELAVQYEEQRRANQKIAAQLLQLKDNLKDTVNAIATIVEMRDPYTAGHQQRVAALAKAIAIEMKLSADDIEAIEIGGIVHDVGKIKIPAEILSKPGTINDIEYSLIKAHPQAGYDILKVIDFPWPIAQMVLQHHERLNGSGYPAGLKDGEILLGARILSVADVVEAMSSHRPYRASLGIDAALVEISAHRGTLFDPQVVDACLTLFHQQDYQLNS
jgi:HD-GYP domain-containing protein (c-di-GMP phosphodiesterase class II)